MVIKALFLSGALLCSSFSLAAVSAPKNTPTFPERTLSCSVEAAFKGESLPATKLSDSMKLDEDGNTLSMILYGDDHQFEVHVTYYRSEIEDDDSSQERIDISIIDIKKDFQEDYISSKVKSLLYITTLTGNYYDASGDKKAFDSISVICNPSYQ